jgi:hypothetical protein
MHHLRLVPRASAFAALLLLGWGCATCFAQGSSGGSIGNDDKSVSGTRNIEPERSSRGSTSEPETRRAPARGGGGGVSRFDGAWMFVVVGCGSGNVAGVIAGGRLSVPNGGGSVGPSGALRAVAAANGLTTVASGHLSGAGGGGVFSRSDGCAGRWTAMKQ